MDQSKGLPSTKSSLALNNPSNHLCSKHCLTVYLLCGLKTNILLNKSIQLLEALLNIFLKSFFACGGRFFLTYLLADSFPIYFISSSLGVPNKLTILCTWSSQSLPGKSGVLLINSAMMQPMDHTSNCSSQCLALRITSGARYHLVTTYSVYCWSG